MTFHNQPMQNDVWSTGARHKKLETINHWWFRQLKITLQPLILQVSGI